MQKKEFGKNKTYSRVYDNDLCEITQISISSIIRFK